MEKSLANIEKSMTSGKISGKGSDAGGSEAASTLNSMATSITLITKALSDNNFKKKSADTIIDFISNLSTVTNSFKPRNLESLGLMTTGLSRFVDSMSALSLIGLAKIMLFGKVLFGGKKPLLETIMVGASKALDSSNTNDIKKIALAGEAIEALSIGLSRMAKAMGALALVAIISPLVIVGAGAVWLVVKMFTKLGEHAKEIKKGGQAIEELGQGLVALSVGLGFMALLVTVVPAEAYFQSIAVIAGFSLAFIVIGKASESISNGGKAVEKMGKGLVMLAAGIAFISLVILIVPPKTLLMGMLLVAGYGLIFALFGKAKAEIADGALVTIVGISLGLFFFAGALLLLAFTIQKIGFLNALGGIALIGIAGALFSWLGVDSQLIYAGAKAVGAMGIGIAIFGAGLLVYALSLKGVMALFKNDWLIASVATVAIIGGIAVMFNYLGANIVLIEQGLIAMGSMGIGIAIFGVGILVYALALKAVMALFKNDWKIAALATVGIILGLATMFAGIGLLIPFIAAGSAAVALIGISLLAFSVGLMVFALATKAIKAMNLLDKDNKFIGANIITSVMDAFANIGIVRAFKAVAGSVALATVGISLLSFAIGLGATAKVLEKADPKKLKEQLFDPGTGIITVLIDQFSKIGKDLGGFNMLFGVDNVSKGARAVSRIGDALSTIAGGIVKFADVDNVPVQIADDKTGKLIYKNVSLSTTLKNLRTVMIGEDGKGGILLTMAKVFGEIGNMPEVTGVPNNKDGSVNQGSFFGNLLRRISGDTPMLRGIRAVSQIGDTLSSLAGGITAFANVDQIPVQFADEKGKLIYKNVSLSTVLTNLETVMIGEDKKGGILLSIAKIFGDIGNMPDVTGIPDNADGTSGTGSFFGNLWRRLTGDTPMIRGMKTVAKIGDTLGSLAGGITAFANIDEIPISVPSADGKSLEYRSVKLSDVISNIQLSLIGDGATGKNPGLLFALASVFAKVDELYPDGIIFDGPIQKGAQSVKDISESIAGIAQTVMAFSELEKRVPVDFDPVTGKPIRWEKIDQQSIRDNLVSFIQLMPKTFAELDSKVLDKAEENAEKFKSVSEVLGDLASPMKNLRAAFLPNKNDSKDQKGILSMISDEITNFVNFLSKNPIQDNTLASLNKLIDVFERFGTISSPFKDFVSAFKDFQDPLALFSTNIKNFSTNFSKFSSQLKNYEKFTGLLNSQALLSKQYSIFVPQFGQMSKDLEIFAKNFKLMDSTAIDSFKIWTEALTNFVKVDPTTFTTIATDLAKLINAPLTAQDLIDTYAKIAKGEVAQGDVSTPATLTNQEGADVLNNTSNKRKSEIEILQQQVSELVTSVNTLVQTLNNPAGLNVVINNT